MFLVLYLDKSSVSLNRSDVGLTVTEMLKVSPGWQHGLGSPTVAARVFKRQAMTGNVGQT